MESASPLERLLRRDRVITISGLTVLCLLAWVYIVEGAGLGASAWDMTRLTLFPHQQSTEMMPGMDMHGMEMEMPGMDMAAMTQVPIWGPAIWVLMIAMWWIMMIAMMSPSAAPTVLLYARVHRQAVTERQNQTKIAPTGTFMAGYLLVWLGFSVLAAVLYWLLEREAVVSTTTMALQSRWLSGAVLIAAGLYQLSPLKNACLSHCRAPAEFLSRHWRPGALGALRAGALHGTYCVGCCWMLMALLFVGGVMNLAWIAALAVLVLVEKLFPAGHWIGRAAGIVLILWGAVTFLI